MIRHRNAQVLARARACGVAHYFFRMLLCAGAAQAVRPSRAGEPPNWSAPLLAIWHSRHEVQMGDRRWSQRRATSGATWLRVGWRLLASPGAAGHTRCGPARRVGLRAGRGFPRNGATFAATRSPWSGPTGCDALAHWCALSIVDSVLPLCPQAARLPGSGIARGLDELSGNRSVRACMWAVLEHACVTSCGSPVFARTGCWRQGSLGAVVGWPVELDGDRS